MSALRRIFVLTLIAGALPLAAQADDWPQWAGPRRDDVWRETGILEQFPPDGPKQLWRIPIGGGYSGPAVVGQRVYVTDRPGYVVPPAGKEAAVPKTPVAGKERVVCLDAPTGKTIWEHEYDCGYKISYSSGPRATPIVEEGRVYTLGAMGDLRCLDAATGKLAWSREFQKDFPDAKTPAWGWSSSPIIEGDRLICMVGGDGSTVVAFDKHTGKELWRALSTQEIAYAPPVVVDAGGKRQLIVWHSEAVAGLDPATGQTYWSVDYPMEGKPQRPSVNIGMPRVVGDKLVLTSFYHGSQMWELTKDKPGVKLLWNQDGKQRLNKGLHTVMCTPIIKDGYVYGVCGYGELRCLKEDTGERVWELRKPTGGPDKTFTNAFLVEQADRVWIYNDQGDLIIAKVSPKGYDEISRAHLLDTTLFTRDRNVTWCAPAFANRCCYVRSDKEMVCVSLAAGG